MGNWQPCWRHQGHSSSSPGLCL